MSPTLVRKLVPLFFGSRKTALMSSLFGTKYGGREIPVVIVTDNPALDFAVVCQARSNEYDGNR